MLLLPAISIATMGRYGLAGLVMIGVLVVIHEFGHFLFAKLFGVGVPVFSVGMGPRLFGIRHKGTDYRISALPVGGYVQMAGADPFGEQDASARVDPEVDFMQKPVWQRLIIMLAGPVFNLVLPFIVFTAVMMTGESNVAPVIGSVIEGSEAEQLGFLPDDRIVAVNGAPIEIYNDMLEQIQTAPAADLNLTLERHGATLEKTIPGGSVGLTVDGLVEMADYGLRASPRSSRVGIDDPNSPAGRAGMGLGDLVTHVDQTAVDTWEELQAALTAGASHEVTYQRVSEGKRVTNTVTVAPSGWSARDDDFYQNEWGFVPVMVYVGMVLKERPSAKASGCMTPPMEATAAFEAGLLPDDRLYRINGQPIRSWHDLTMSVEASIEGRSESEGPRPISMDVLREGKLVSLTMTPHITREIYRGGVRFRPLIGVQQYPSAYVSPEMVDVYYGFTEAVPKAVEQGSEVFWGTLGMLGKLFTQEVKAGEALGGPVAILQAAGQAAEGGFHTFARLLGTISFSLGIINLLPLPVLDGGQIVFYSIEGIRGRPLSLAIRERVQMIGVLAIIALMLAVTVNDVSRWIGG